ncbi:hypothetical protein LV83_00888 [Algoriphagus yeomjeoni]|uniref:Uncharacterized protein n=1 Tax=Algoriphagus yeomjeoni TaxID=291403 RepID=A0A327PS67_9BACT|nr:hypothetical protein LV83_00888 [Algoriphagus yeomjeoni]
MRLKLNLEAGKLRTLRFLCGLRGKEKIIKKARANPGLKLYQFLLLISSRIRAARS